MIAGLLLAAAAVVAAVGLLVRWQLGSSDTLAGRVYASVRAARADVPWLGRATLLKSALSAAAGLLGLGILPATGFLIVAILERTPGRAVAPAAMSLFPLVLVGMIAAAGVTAWAGVSLVDAAVVAGLLGR